MTSPELLLAAKDTPNGDIGIYQIGTAVGTYTLCCMFAPTYSATGVWQCGGCEKDLMGQPVSNFPSAASVDENGDKKMSELREVFIRIWIEAWTGVPLGEITLDVDWD